MADLNATTSCTAPERGRPQRVEAVQLLTIKFNTVPQAGGSRPSLVLKNWHPAEWTVGDTSRRTRAAGGQRRPGHRPNSLKICFFDSICY